MFSTISPDRRYMDDDLLQQAYHALSSYIGRTSSSISCLSNGEIDKALRILRLSRAAWYNFVALYERASNNQSMLTSPQGACLRNSAAEAFELSETLAKAITLTLNDLTDEKNLIWREKSRIQKFHHSTEADYTSFFQTV